MQDESYTREVGERLRRIRREKGLSLQDVERLSRGRWKAAVVGSYERGDRNISAARLCELAEFYGVSPRDILPTEQTPPTLTRPRGIALDLQRLEQDSARWEPVLRYCRSIQRQRGDYNREVLSIRAEDLRALSVITDRTPEELLAELREAGILLGD